MIGVLQKEISCVMLEAISLRKSSSLREEGGEGMNTKLKTTTCVLLFLPTYFLLYAFFHEAGHALVILAYGGTIDEFVVLSLTPYVSAIGTELTVFGAALLYVAGLLLPTLVGALVLSFYRPSARFDGYHACFFITLLSLLNSILLWVSFPALSLFMPLPRGEDVTRFLDVVGVHPLFVSLGALFLAGALLLLAYQKGILGNVNERFTALLEGSRSDEEIQRSRWALVAFVLLVMMTMPVIYNMFVLTQ